MAWDRAAWMRCPSRALNRVMGAGWDVRPSDDLRMNNMLRDDRLKSGSVADRLRWG
jgi:hypothetical protein